MAEIIAKTAADLIASRELDPFSQAAVLRCIPVLLRTGDPPDLAVTGSNLALCATLVENLRDAGDLTAAAELATRCMEWVEDAPICGELFDRLAAQRLALAALDGTAHEVAALAEAVVDRDETAVYAIEGKVWAAIMRLQDPATRGSAIEFTGALEPELDPAVMGEVANRFRLQLGAELVRVEEVDGAKRMLAPLLEMPDDDPFRRDAEILLVNAHGAASVWVLAIALLENELSETPESRGEDRLRLTSALAEIYPELGDWRHALQRSSEACHLTSEKLGVHHPETLRMRSDIANWTGMSGDSAGALQLLTELLPDQIRVLGPDHPSILSTRANIAYWIDEIGEAAGALQLLTELLPDQIRVLGPDHPTTITTRGNLAYSTGRNGDTAKELQLYRASAGRGPRFGPDDPRTLNIRNNIASGTGKSGDPARALQLFTELLPDQVRVLGPDHPNTLRTRNNIAYWTGRSGDSARALQLRYRAVAGPGPRARTRSSRYPWRQGGHRHLDQ